MTETLANVNYDHLPFYITAPGETDGLFIVVAIFLILVVIAFGAFWFTVQSIPDRMVEGTSKAQMQVVGILGLLSLFTFSLFVIALLAGVVIFTLNFFRRRPGIHFPHENEMKTFQTRTYRPSRPQDDDIIDV